MTRKVNWKRTLKVQYLEDSVLHHAVDNDDVEKCRDLLSKGYDPNIVDYIIDDADYTPLMRAAEKGNMEICQLLCDKGADLSCVDRFGRTAPTIAAEEGHLQVGLYLLCQNTDMEKIRSFNLYYAAKEGNIEKCKKVLKTEVDINLVHMDYKETPLYIAAKMGHSEICELLIENGANSNIKGGSDDRSPIYFVCKDGNIQLAELMLSQGLEDPKIVDISLSKSSECGHLELCQLLCANGANIDNTEHYGKTPLYAAAENGHLAVCQYLYEMGADVNAVYPDEEYTPLMIAAQHGHLEVCKFLCEKGSDLSSKHSSGETTLSHH